VNFFLNVLHKNDVKAILNDLCLQKAFNISSKGDIIFFVPEFFGNNILKVNEIFLQGKL